MKSIKSPKQIPGLTFWLDADDISTINNGKILNNGIVKSFRDKISGIELTNIIPTGGPNYSMGQINSRNVISFQPVYSIGGEANNFGLGALNLNLFTSATTSIYCVYYPTDSLVNDSGGNQKYVFNLIDDVMYTSPKGYGNKSVYLGDESGATPTQRLNPSGRYIEADTTTFGANGYDQYVTYHEHVPSRNSWTQSGVSLNKLCITSARCRSGLKKISFVFNSNDYLEDFNLGGLSNGVPTPTGNVSRGIKLTGPVFPVSSPHHISLGSYIPKSYTYGPKIYPFKGYFCEFLYFNRFLTDEESNTIKQYFKKKWGI